MKFTAYCKLTELPDEKSFKITTNTENDYQAAKSFLNYIDGRNKRDNTDICPEVRFYQEAKERTYEQIKTVFKLLEAILITQLGRKPIKSEKDEAYKDLLEMYADRRPCLFDENKLVPVGLSNSDVYQGSRLIMGAIDILVNMCNTHPDNNYFITTNVEADVRHYINEWYIWRGGLKKDPVDYIDYEKGKLITEREWEKRHPVCEACHLSGTDFDPLEKAHIVSVGSSGIEEPWDWLRLHISHHRFLQHQKGWVEFLNKYPHLIGRVARAKELAGKRELYA